MTWRDVLDGRSDYAIVRGDALARLRAMPDECVQVCVTSPPYYGLRDYGLPPSVWGGRLVCAHKWGAQGKSGTRLRNGIGSETAKVAMPETLHPSTGAFCVYCGAWRGCLGLEPTTAMFLEHLVELFREVRRVLRPDGTLWVNLGDSYAGSGKGPTGHSGIGDQGERQGFTDKRLSADGYKPKDLMMMPARLAIALQEDGWYLRSEITWCLSGGTLLYVRAQKGDMPMSVKDLARLNPSTVQLWNGERWTRVVKVWENHEPGDPLEIELRSGETIGCTPEHLWPTERGLVQAKDLTVGDVLKSTRLPEPDVPRSPVALDDADIGWFVGLYLAEGCVNGKYISIASHIRETERFERVRRIAQAFDGSATFRHAGGNGATITVYGRILRAIIEEYISGSGAKSKRLSNACWRRSNVFLRGLIDGYLHGDGHWEEKTGRWRLGFTRNYYLAADMRTLCARLDVHIRLRPRFATMNGRSLPSFRGEIRFTRSGHRNERPDTEIVRIGYSKGRKFWDIEVEDEPHTFALASGVLTHNCKSSAMPESVRDRPTSATERIYLLSKSAQYFYDADAVKQTAEFGRRTWTNPDGTWKRQHEASPTEKRRHETSTTTGANPESGANLRNFWPIPTTRPMLRLREDLTPEQRAYVLRRLADGIDRADHV